jgi:polyisoprenyl-teichoic acid--peptidoglycan teichoic acid transferase
MSQDHRKQTQKTHRIRWHLFLSISALTAFIAGAAAYDALTRPLTHGQQTRSIIGRLVQPRIPSDPDRTNILLLGTDTRPGDPAGNSDVIVFCSLDRKNKRIELMSIPRDTKVQFPDGRFTKINEGMQIGGPTLTVTLVENLLKQPVDHYALTHFSGLVDIINTVGGVTLNVPERMYYNTGDSQYNLINLHKGVQTLNGEQALGFVRFRHDELGDIGRTERQQAFLVALEHQLLQPSNLTKLPTLVREFWGTMDSDLNVLEVVRLASRASQYQDYSIVHETLPGSFHDPDPSVANDASYWIVNTAQSQYAAKELLNKGVVQSNPIQDPGVTANWGPPAPPPSSVENGPAASGRSPESQKSGAP